MKFNPRVFFGAFWQLLVLIDDNYRVVEVWTLQAVIRLGRTGSESCVGSC
jgi:hypothetical protein